MSSMLQFGCVCHSECAEELLHDEVGGDGDGGDDGHHDEVGAGHGGQGQVVQLLPASRHQGGAEGRHQRQHGVDAANLITADGLAHQGPVVHFKTGFMYCTCVLRPDHVHGIQEAEEAAKAEPVEDKAA